MEGREVCLRAALNACLIGMRIVTAVPLNVVL
jgi:hypothetical protein